ncbi:MAG: histidine phosphatase family protein [Porticoccaceae bacterium]|jgi:broad specificity phosphatase PhoE|nr:histidine phosphatase family protein [Porticoccaceae bacterium]|tara:strand:+ start:10701 stop:11393 length:693 start_codon:yes stop_codon:yes gene_type:complete
MSELHLVRHAQASFGSVNYDQLSELGHRQARFLGDHFKLRNMRFDQLVVGDMHRHHQTMDGICEGLGIDGTNRLVLPGLNEYNFVDMTEAYGKIHGDNPLFQKVMEDPTDKKNYYRLLRQILMAWTSDSIPGVPETWIEFKSRVEDAQNQIKAMAGTGNSILAIGSGGSISTFVGLALGIPDENIFDLNLQYKNTAISHFFFNQKKMNLTGFNSVTHLDTNEMEQYITYG